MPSGATGIITIDSRDKLRDYCLRKLGYPVIDINVDVQQVQDRIDDALDRFYDYHFDGNEEKYFIVKIQDADVVNNYITFDTSVYSVVKVYPFSASNAIGAQGLFSAQYQFFLNDFYSGTGAGAPGSMGIQGLYNMQSYIATLENQFNPVKSFRFNRKTNRVYFSQPMSSIKSYTDYLMFKIYSKLDPDVFPDMWNDWFLKAYTTALIKKQWGNNIKKFGTVNLPGGVTLNGQAIYTEAVEEIALLEQKLENDLQEPVDFICG